MSTKSIFTSPLVVIGVVIWAMVSGIFFSWLVLLYSTYGQQTLLFILKAPPQVMWSYTRGVFVVPAATTQSQIPQQRLGSDTSSSQSANPIAPTAQQLDTPAKFTISQMSHMYQKLNNCGPSSAAMAASSLGIEFDQFFAAEKLKGGEKDKNVSPEELVSFLKTQNLEATYRIQGNPQTIEQLVAQGIPVIVEQWLVKRGSGELVGHYRVVRGYDRQRQLFITNDSFNGANFIIPYSQFDEWWRPFNRTYIAVYPTAQVETVKNILGESWSTTGNFQQAKAIVDQEVTQFQDGYAYFNVGSTAVGLGEYTAAATAYDQALSQQFPEHFLWYQFGPLEAYYQNGNYEKVLHMTEQLLQHAGDTEEAYYYRGLVFMKQGQTEVARAEWEKALVANPRYIPAQEALAAP